MTFHHDKASLISSYGMNINKNGVTMDQKKIKYLSVKEFAQFCGVSSQTVHQWIRNKQIKASKGNQSDYSIAIDHLSDVKIEKNERTNTRAHYDFSAKALVIDDEAESMDVINPAFSRYGFKIFNATDAFSALSIIHEESPLIITLDLKMLDLNGKEILKMITNLGYNQRSWIIVISAASEATLISAVDCGADFYLQKPFAVDDLEKIIKKLSFDLKKEVA